MDSGGGLFTVGGLKHQAQIGTWQSPSECQVRAI